MGCEIEKKQRKCMGIGEVLLGVILIVVVFLTCGQYWTYVYEYKERSCDEKYRGNEKYVRDESGNEKYERDESGKKIYNPYITVCRLRTERYYSASSKEKIQCQYFDVDKTLPNSSGVQTIVALSVIIFIGTLIFRAVFLILFLCEYTDERKNKITKYDFWSINLMLTAMHVGMYGFIHLYYLKYTNICVESPIDDYNGDGEQDEYVTYDNLIFYVLLVFVIIYNCFWYFSITNKSCKDCWCSLYVYWIINMLMSASMMIFIYTLSKTQKMLPIIFTLYVIAYFALVGLNICKLKSESKKASKISPRFVEDNNKGAMAVENTVQPVVRPPVEKAQPTNQYYAGILPGQYFPGQYAAQPNYGGQPAGGYAPQPYAQPAPEYAPAGYPPQQNPVASPAQGSQPAAPDEMNRSRE